MEWNMTGNTFAGLTCVYCGLRPSTTDDHVFAKKFFLEPRRQNLPQAPACAFCNLAKGAIEHELLAVLPFAGRHIDASENLARLAARRLAKNLRQKRALASGTSPVWLRDGSLYKRTIAVPMDWVKLEKLFALIARGLAWHHWNVLIGPDCFSNAHILQGTTKAQYTRMQGQRAAARVDANLGAGTFIYRGAQATDNPTITIWEFSIYRGLRATNRRGPIEEEIKVGAMTGPLRVLQRGELKASWLGGTRLHR